MKLKFLGSFIGLLACCSGHAGASTYFFAPSDANVGLECMYRFPISGIQGDVTSAMLSVSPFALPNTDSTLSLNGYESTTPFLSGPVTSFFDIGTRYIPLNMQFGDYWDLDVTDFIRSVTLPYVEIDITSSDSFTTGARLRVTTTPVPEPSSFVCLAVGLGVTLIASRYRRRIATSVS
jgi:hypothetical protein